MPPSSNILNLPASELTPVRIRGKRKRPKTPLSSQDSSNEQLHHDTRHSQALPAKKRKSKGGNARSRESKTASRRSSRLESLPVELIEQIFLDCLEFNLPRASPYLAAVLSTDLIYRGLILLSFWNDPAPDDHVSTTIIESTFRPFRYTPLDLAERHLLQLSVLNCRWFTKQRIMGLIETFFKLSLHRWISIARDAPRNRGRVPPFNFDGTVEWIIIHYDPMYRFQDTLDQPHSRQPLLSFKRPDSIVKYSSQSPIAVLAFPIRLLQGNPWTDEKVWLLAFLRKHVTITQRDPEFWAKLVTEDAIREGIRSAILERNPRVLLFLIELDDSCRQAKANWPQRGVPYTLPGEYFVMASRQEQHAIPILRLLIRAAPLSVPPDDAELTEWTIESRDRGEVFGSWLAKYMQDLPVIIKRGEEVFREGRPDPSTCPLYGWEYETVFGAQPKSWFDELTMAMITR
ncbi:hypothetical protein PRK78_006969 [Emydomyces testavorans]|uniref:Uncharacterized protein n=1 Tax=Emydomyces testavorans TaxID=2070801 RepID=A0AAF0DMF0_9EURO|nr:hypothetical protein PRK78_006969 [Emydomyces testavorans]